LRAAAFAFPWHRPPGQVWRRSNPPQFEIASAKNKSALAMTEFTRICTVEKFVFGIYITQKTSRQITA
jgi:hypothetical protein